MQTRAVPVREISCERAVVAVVVGPLLVTLFTSVKTQAQLASTSPILPPAPGAWNWDNYAEVLGAKLLPVQ